MTELARLRQARYLSALDHELARALGRIGGESDPRVLLGAALASRQIREGHVCADLARFAGAAVGVEAELPGACFPELSGWLAALERSPLCGDGSRPTPLVLDASHRLYLARYYWHERALAASIRARARPWDGPLDGLDVALRRVFAERRGEGDRQRDAAIIAALSSFSVIYGGPGTGKTSTVVKLLALLFESSPERALPRAMLLAPTGKAAARLSESVERALGGLDLSSSVREAIPRRASTIHRALGARADDATVVRHDGGRPLPAEIVVVDESSMVDVALMRRLLDAVHPRARLILLGDSNQLASVEAGAVLGDICSGARNFDYSPDLRARARAVFAEDLAGSGALPASPLRDCLLELEQSHRFDPASGIGALAHAVRRGDPDAALAALAQGPEATLVELSGSRLEAELGRAIVRGFGAVYRQKSAKAALAALDSFRLLAAHKRGARGVEGLNQLAETVLEGAGLLSRGPESRFYRGRPILVVQNDHQLELYNGDVGVLWPGPKGVLVACFADGRGGIRELTPARLPPHETVFATSIHKSQGSELEEVAIVLPEADSPLSSRELLYTALTRARQRVVVYGGRAELSAAIERRVRRDSGLSELLWSTA